MLTNLRVLKLCRQTNTFFPLLTFSRMLNQLHIGPHISFFTNSTDVTLSKKDCKLITPKNSQNDRPLCYLGGWYAAQKPHLMKFVEIYLGQEFDVLLVQTETDTFSTPAAAKRMNETLIQFLQNNLQYNQIVIHGFSSAVFNFSHIMWMLDEDRRKKEEILQRFKAQIWDSPGVRPASGFGHAVVKENVMLRNIVIRLYDTFINIFGRTFNNTVKKSNDTFHHTDLKCPALFFCSQDDELIEYKGLAETMKFWAESGINVRTKCWEKSRHVTHFRNYTQEYKQELANQLNSVGLLKNPQLLVSNISSKY